MMAPASLHDSPRSLDSDHGFALPKSVPRPGRLIHRSLVNLPSLVVSAKGIELELASDETVIDACSGAAVALLGHGNQEVVKAMVDQASQLSYVHTGAYTTTPAEQLADIILEGNPYGLEKAFFVGSGSEAVESALKLARQYYYEKNEPQRLHFVSRLQSYHGNTIAAMSVSSNVARKAAYQGFSYPHVSYVSPAYAYQYQRPGETEEQFATRLVMEVEQEFLRVGPEKVIAFIAETVVGATTGCVLPPKGYFRGIREVCNKYDILLIMDEIMSGIGRTGTYFAFEQEGIVPDIVTIAKGLGGGYAAIAGILIHEKVVDVIRRGSQAISHGHTYQDHPISCAAALAVQRIIKRDNLVARCADLGKTLERLLRAELSDLDSVGDIRGRGLFWGVEFVRDKTTKQAFDPAMKFGIRVQQAAFKRGVALYPGSGTIDGLRGDHVLVAPPFIATEDHLEHICRVIKEAIEETEAVILQDQVLR